MLALTLCRSGADSGGYPSRKTDTCDGVTRRLVSCALSSLKGLHIRGRTRKCGFGKYENLLNAHFAKFKFAIRRVFRKYASQ